MAQSNKNPEKDFNKIFNGTPPRSMQNSGGDLDSFCPEIEQATTPTMDSTIPQAEGGKGMGNH